MNVPQTQKASFLDAVNPEARFERTADCIALYEGGEALDARKDKLIIRRKVEEGRGGVVPGNSHYHHRKKRSQYINRVGGLIDGAVSILTQFTPRVAIRNLEEATPEAVDFWTEFNLDADGEGKSFPNFVRDLVRDEITSGRFYSEVYTDDDRLCVTRVDPLNILDWGDGWVKARYCSGHRTGGDFGPLDAEKYEWVYYTKDGSVTFVGYKKDGQWISATGEPLGSDPEISVDSTTIVPPGLDDSPLYSFLLPRPLWLLDRVFDVAVALFNAEIDLSFSLAQAAYPQPVLTLNDGNTPEEIVQSEMAVFILRPGEAFEYKAPGFTAFDSLFKNVDRLKKAFSEAVQMVSQEAASIPQVGRMSAQAIEALRGPASAILNMYSWAVLSHINEIIEDIKEYRGEENLDIYVQDFGEVLVTPELEQWLKANGEEDDQNGNRNGSGPVGGTDEEAAQAGESGDGDSGRPELRGTDSR